jgi:transcriptional regulator with XRE-family HTH domain
MYTKREARGPLFAERLHHLRCTGNWTLDTLAEVVGVSKTMIHYWERGRSYPKATQLENLAAALGTTISYLTGIEEAVQSTQERPVVAARPALIEAVEAARQRIAEAAGMPLRCIRITIDLSELVNKRPRGNDDLQSD